MSLALLSSGSCGKGNVTAMVTRQPKCVSSYETWLSADVQYVTTHSGVCFRLLTYWMYLLYYDKTSLVKLRHESWQMVNGKFVKSISCETKLFTTNLISRHLKKGNIYSRWIQTLSDTLTWCFQISFKLFLLSHRNFDRRMWFFSFILP